MRVLFWSELFLPYLGGAEIFAGQLLPALAERGHEFTIVTSHHNFDLPDEDEHQGIPVHRLPFRRALGDVDPDSLMDARQRVNQLLRDCTPDIIHVSGVGPSAVFCLQCIKETAPVLFVSLHHELLPSQTRTRQSVLSRLLARADWVSSVSSNVLEQARVLEPGIRDRSSVIYNFIDATAPPAQPRTLESPVLLCLGRLVPQKGFDVALKAFADVRKRIPAARLVIAGDGEMRGRLEELASDLGLGEGVEFTGWVEPDAVADLIQSATMILLPSRHEGLPLVATLGALLRRPLVATPAGGLPELVRHMETGMMVPREDPVALAEAVIHLVEHPEEAKALAAAARRHALDLFDRERCIEAYDSVYKHLAARTP